MRKQTVFLSGAAAFLFGLIAPAVWAQNTVQTIGGGGPNNLPALKSSMGEPTAVALDAAGNLYIADGYSQRVFRVDTTGNVTVFAGNGSSGDGSPAINAGLAIPSGLAVDRSGNIFIAEQGGCRITEVSAQTGNISTVAGSDQCWYSGDGGPATSATLNQPSGVAVDTFGNIFIADTGNCLVREVSGSTGVITTVAGTPPDINGLLHCGYTGDGVLATSTQLTFPGGVAVDGSGNILIADTGSCEIREVSASTGIISDVAGTPVTPSGCSGYSGDGGLATSASLNGPLAVTVDSSGDIFIADTNNYVIRRISAATGIISTVAGNGTEGYSGDGTSATSAQLKQPFDLAVDSSGDIFIADYDNSVVREVSAATGNISTFAGVAVPDPYQVGQMIGFPAYCGDGYPATDAEFGNRMGGPWAAGLATDSSGNVFLADTGNSAIREISATTGIITTVAGNGFAGYSGDGGPATSAELFAPRDVAVDGSGNLFIVDSGNCVIREISASTGIISTVAGTPPDSSGNYYCGYSGDGGPATSAELYPIDLLMPAGGVAVDSSGNLFIADSGNNIIREVSASTGIINTVAGIPCEDFCYVGGGDGGPATSATLFTPYGVAVDGSGNIYIADTYDFVIREVMAVNGNIYTVAGNMALSQGFSGDGGSATSAQLRSTYGVLLDPAGNLFIPDPGNCVIREVSASTGIISTVAGTPQDSADYYSCGYWGDGGPALSAGFDFPGAVASDPSEDLVVLDNVRVRTVAGLVQGPAAGAVAFPSPLAFSTVQLGTSNTLTAMLSDRGSLTTNVSTVTISGANASDFSETDNCAGGSLAAGGGSCTVNVKFTPSIAAAESALLTITDTAGTQTVNLSGVGANFLVVAPSPLVFPSEPLGTSNSLAVTLSDEAALATNVSAVAISGANASDFSETGNCVGAYLWAVGNSCTVDVKFTPSITGAESALLTISGTFGALTVNLSGAGMDFSVGAAPGGSLTSTVTQGQTATYSLQVSAIGGMSASDAVSVTVTCSGAAPETACVVPASIAATVATPGAFTVSVTTTAPTQSGIPLAGGPRIRNPVTVLVFGMALLLLAFGLCVRMHFSERHWRSPAYQTGLAWLAFAGPMVLAIVLMGCAGGGSGSPPPLSGGTPTGTYTLTLKSTAGSVSHTTSLTLVVNALQ